MTFHVGQRVVFIEDDWSHPLIHLVSQFPRKGRIYHIRTIGRDHDDGELYLRFAEIVNPIPYSREPDFIAFCFRPLVEKKTDISIFTAMLKQKQRAHEFTI